MERLATGAQPVATASRTLDLIRECGSASRAGGQVDLTAALANERPDVDVARDVAVLEHHVGVEGQQVTLELCVESANGWLASR